MKSSHHDLHFFFLDFLVFLGFLDFLVFLGVLDFLVFRVFRFYHIQPIYLHYPIGIITLLRSVTIQHHTLASKLCYAQSQSNFLHSNLSFDLGEGQKLPLSPTLAIPHVDCDIFHVFSP